MKSNTEHHIAALLSELFIVTQWLTKGIHKGSGCYYIIIINKIKNNI